MRNSSFRKYLTQPVAGAALFALFVAAAPVPGMAQLPTLPDVPPERVNTIPLEEAYTLGSGDRVRMDIFDVPEYSGEFQVLANGILNLPVVGSVSVQGLTIERASAVISQRYARYVKRPIVTLSLLSARPLRISVGGEVKRPGSYSIPLTDGQQFPTVTQAIELAEGITRSADVRNVEVRRRGKPPFRVNLWDLLNSSNLNQDVTLRDGDEIFLPTTTAINPIESRQLANASFAPDASEPIKVAVVGEVVRPGPYTVAASTAGASTADRAREGGDNREPPTVTQAIQVAGGIKQSADIRRVEVRRTTRDGDEQVLQVNLWTLLQEGDLSQDVILQEGDTIVVPEATEITAEEATELASASFSAAIISVNVVGEVEKPGTVQVPANSPLNQALLAAGGFDNRRARKSSVELVRLNPNGTVTKREVNVDFTAGVNDQSNPPLRPNDVIIVRRSGLTSFTDTLGTAVSPLGSFFTIFRLFNLF
ncbi:SLBB domain-containing protein [Coleofasciculus sp. LEGE 07092]|nr:SLBB domain-containing protein [Coleofasciculus sp. LEGE 07081]MBE9150588.1 SLBB domain-containing protein [Coleofasciculus sp. LEGE 07092]